MLSTICRKINKSCFRVLASVLPIIFVALSMSLYHGEDLDDIRTDPYCRRVLNLLPSHTFTPTHDADYLYSQTSHLNIAVII
jgi:hypothetical protein